MIVLIILFLLKSSVHFYYQYNLFPFYYQYNFLHLKQCNYYYHFIFLHVHMDKSYAGICKSENDF